VKGIEILLGRIDALLGRKGIVVCAIDGACAAGKSTLAAHLKSIYGCNVFSMDDFFLQPWQRTAERLAEPGGNVDRERFEAEVLAPLLQGRPFAYRRYDCSVQALAGGTAVRPHALNIVEGVYCLHPFLSGAYDLKVFMGIGAEEQKKRLMARGPEKYARFASEWIPMENRYFEAFKVAEGCDLVLGEAT
jgi:uridine kinase